MAGFMHLNLMQLTRQDLADLIAFAEDDEIREYWSEIDQDLDEANPPWAARYSAPGYLDCTAWVVDPKPVAAAKLCFSLYGNDESYSDDRNELACILWQCRAQGYRS